jgi:hypothetical protein
VNIFYCLRYEISLFVASYDSQVYGRGIRPLLHKGISIKQNTLIEQCILTRVGGGVRVTKTTGYRSDDWIYWHFDYNLSSL